METTDLKAPNSRTANTRSSVSPSATEIAPSSEVDFDTLQVEVLRELRGPQSTRTFSQLLGYGFDQVARWENRRVRLKWASFARIAKTVDLDLQAEFFRVFGFWCDACENPKVFSRNLFQHIVGPISHRETARRLSVSEDTIDRWIYGRSELTFVDVCLILHEFTGQAFFSWVSGVVKGATLRSIESQALSHRAEQSVHLAFPYAGAIEAAVQLQAYKDSAAHSSTQISFLTGLSVELVDRVLPVLVSSGRLKMVGGKFQVESSFVNIQGGSRAELSRLTRYWSEKALARFQTSTGLPITKRKNPNAVLFRVAPLSKKATLAVTEALLKCHNEISQIVENDREPAEEIRVIVGHHFSADETPGFED